MRVTLHLGTHKTGTTSIQDSFAAARDWLAEREVLYPWAGCETGENASTRHVVLSHAGDGSPRQAEEIARLKAEMVRSGARHTILSAEGWCTFKRRKRLKRLISQLRCDGHDVSGVVFLRNRYRFARSHYREWTQVHGNGLDFASYVLEYAVNWDYIAMARRLNRLFDGNIEYLCFEDAADSVSALCTHLGVARPAHVLRSNPSLDAVETEIFRQLNAAGVPDPGSVDLEAVFGDMPFWRDRGLYGEVMGLPGLACSREWALALQRLTELGTDQVDKLVARPLDPVYRVDALRTEIAERLRQVSGMAA